MMRRAARKLMKKIKPVVGGVYLPIPDLRCGKSGTFLSVAISDDHNWLVFIDTKSKFYWNKCCCYHECFLWNRHSHLKLQLPPLPDEPECFFKCIIRTPGRLKLDGPDYDPTLYQVIFFYKNLAYRVRPYFIWSRPTLQEWESLESVQGILNLNRFCDAVSFYKMDDNILCGITNLGELMTYDLHITTKVQSPNYGSFIYVRRLVVINRELHLIERKAQWGWELCKIDYTLNSCVSVPPNNQLEGIAIFVSGNYAYPQIGLEEGNCIFFTEDDDEENFYVFRLGDQSLSIFKNQPSSRFPLWFNQMGTNDFLVMPWLSFAKGDSEKNVKISEAVDEDDEINLNENCDSLKEEDHLFSELPNELQWLVMQSLHNEMDHANFRSTCRKFRELAPPICWKPDISTSAPVELPWLMLFYEKDSTCSSFIDPSCNIRYFKNNQELSGCKILYSNDGWLLVTQNMRKLFFFELFSKTKITLPNLPEDFHIDGISFSSSPTYSDWVIIAIVSTPRRFCIAFLRSFPNRWYFTDIRIRWTSFISCGCNPVFHDNKFYSLGRDGSLVYFSLENLSTRFISPTSTDRSKKLRLSSSCRGYLVSCEDGLYLVRAGLLGKFINVYKLDEVASKWNEVKSIDNFSFFISQTSSFAIPMTKREEQNSINLPLFAENRYLSYKLDASEFKSYSGDYYKSRGLYERKELFCGTWIQPKVVRAYRW